MRVCVRVAATPRTSVCSRIFSVRTRRLVHVPVLFHHALHVSCFMCYVLCCMLHVCLMLMFDVSMFLCVAGQERFRTITTSYYRSADAILLVFDLCDDKTFRNLEAWMEDVR